MIGRSVSRIARMNLPEILWRTRAAARIAFDRGRSAVSPVRWQRQDLAHVLAPLPELDAARASLGRGSWADAHRALARHTVAAAQRFVIGPHLRSAVSSRILAEFPGSRPNAIALADRIVAGDYDLLGYQGLRFDSRAAVSPCLGDSVAAARALDWHYDPVHQRRAPRRFWSAVPYLEPVCGDHKIIWELNRHQHWLVLGRAYWLTGDATYRDACVDQLEAWIEANPPLAGINWASMLELGLRSISWIWALNFFADPDAGDRSPWIVDLLLALDRQLTHVERNLSHYFSANTHLLGEALALYVAGRALPALAASPRREALGRRILLAEIARQISADGGHCERSTHYHRYTLDFYLLALAVARITKDPIAADFEVAAAQLAFAARRLADDRGRLPHIGDDDGGMLLPMCGRAPDDIRDSLATAAALVGRPDLRVGRAPEESFWMMAHSSLSPTLELSQAAPVRDAVTSAALPDTGYHVSRSAAGDHLVIDGGPHGYQNGGHAHADALSLTFAVRGVPLLIDPGTGCYTTDPELRNRLRSTALHNTLLVDNRPQSIPDGPFNWTHTAAATVNRWRTNGSFDYFAASHDGYQPLVHHRHVLALHGDLLIVADLVEGTGAHAAVVHWHIDPRWHVDVRGRRVVFLIDGRHVELMVPQGAIDAFSADAGTGLGWHAPVYGRLEPATTIRVADRGNAPLWMVSVFGLNPDNAIVDVETVPIWAEAGTLIRSAGVRISRAASTDYCLVAEPAGQTTSLWRIAEIETDARMLFSRLNEHGHLTRLALVDGSRVRAAGRHRLQLALPRQVPDLHLDLSGITASQPSAVTEVRLSGSGFGARVVVGGQELPIAIERRTRPRPQVGIV
jgi:hypothetical protein